MKLLVAYATKHGSTAEVAEFIGQIFREHYVETTVMRVEDVHSVDGYGAFVLGSPVYASLWLSEMSQFLERFEGGLSQKPVYYWMNCIRVLEAGGREHALAEYVYQPTMKKIGVRDIAVFGGKLNIGEIDWNERWTLVVHYEGDALPGSRNDDYRDWNAIREWATQIRSQLEGE